MLINWFAFALMVTVLIWAVAMFLVLRKWFTLYRFRLALATLVPTEIPTEVPDIPGELGRLLERFIASFRRANDSNSLSRFDVNRQSTPLILALRGATAGLRNVAGLLILLALVITLLNLQGAVFDLGSTFKQLSQHAKLTPGSDDGGAIVDRVQGMMGDVAGTAARAFLVSGLTVFGAMLLLALASCAEVEIRKGLRAFNSWAHETYSVRISEVSRQSSGDTKADFSAAIDEFRSFVDSFGKLSSELSNLGDFRQQLADASSSISDAVNRIPAAIGENMNLLSSQVTREIAEDLRHQYEILNNMLMTYGDMGVNVKKLEEFIERMIKGYEQASAAVAKLGTLPEDTVELRNSIRTLSTCVSQIPALEIRATAALLSTVNENVTSLRGSCGVLGETVTAGEKRVHADLDQVRQQLSAALDGQKRLPSEFEKMVQNHVAQIRERIETLDARLGVEYGDKLDQIQAQLSELRTRGLFDMIWTRNRGS